MDDPQRQCSRCQGTMIWANFRPEASTVGMLFTRKRKDGFFGPQLNQSACAALVCSECGFTELYATQPKDLVKEDHRPAYRPAPAAGRPAPPPPTTCARCAGLMQAVAVEGSGSSASVRFRKEWQADVFTRSTCAVRVCAHCGYAEFYATAPGPLLGGGED